jgi:hypothetical protein
MNSSPSSEHRHGPAVTTGRQIVPETFRSESAIIAIQSHPRFREAVALQISCLRRIYLRNRLLNRVLNDRGRFMAAMAAMYLHYFAGTDDDSSGLTPSRFQATCVEQGICSAGRARALLAQMRLVGYLELAPGGTDRRRRRLLPTAAFIALHQERWECHLRALALLKTEMQQVLEVCNDPKFMECYLRRLGADYLKGHRILHQVPEMASFAETNSGLLLVSSLFVAEPTEDSAAASISISALAAQFGVARAHARKIVVQAEAVT